MVHRFAKEGARVYALDVSGMQDAVAAAIGSAATSLQCDVTNPEMATAAFDAIERECGQLDILCNQSAEGKVMLDRYGPTALIAGASVGIGAALAERLAEMRFDLILVGRDEISLHALATDLKARFGIGVCIIVQDLRANDAADAIATAAAGIEVGFLGYIAGAVPPRPFMDQSDEEMMDAVRLNALTPMALCRRFGASMCERRRGAILLGGSGAALAGSGKFAVYSAAKAFQMILGESLWLEMRSKGVDVLNLLIHATHTPTAERLGMKFDALADRRPMLPAEVAQEGLLNIRNGPTWWAGRENFELARRFCTTDRRAATEFMSDRLEQQVARSKNSPTEMAGSGAGPTDPRG